jgi:DNA repair protein RecO (recombination protein O)
MNEADALVAVLAEERGAWRGLVRGGLSRRHAATWQTGNLLALRWMARLDTQLGTVTGELVHASAAPVLDDPLALAILQSACALAELALPEHEPHPRLFRGLVHLLAHLPEGPPRLADLVRWEAALLEELGYGLDLTVCAVSGATSGLAYVSPRTGRAVAAPAAGVWASRLLPLPGFLLGGEGSWPDWQAGLALTGHFLARDALGALHRPLPAARLRLSDLVARQGGLG